MKKRTYKKISINHIEEKEKFPKKQNVYVKESEEKTQGNFILQQFDELPIMEQLNQIEKYFTKENIDNNENKPEIVFAISLKSKRVSQNWGRVQENLAKTLRSILKNTDQNFRVIIAGHKKPDIAELNHDRVKWIRVKFPPPKNSKGFYFDKIRKRLVIGAFLRKIGFSGYFMPVDADDWIHYRFVEYIRSCPVTDAFVFNRGYMVNLAKKEIWLRYSFYTGCGTSQLFYFRNEEFPETSRIRDVQRTNFRVAVGKRHANVLTYLKRANKNYMLVNYPLLTWVLAHGDNNSMILGKKDNLISAKHYNAQGENLDNWLFNSFKILE
ncbi:hypothetical protein [Metabacillus halosaccharovorans]|uniref:hypothetical protein n=1 Tax=Metabacillus halosaccharovorans TaxID=930124 RepID=UPI00203CF878|nr:hypothetical protein [Metabacillus halosaccharovorans]MCM3439695.1 hypothetical protein [Metabacillus halosaccharovorans]